MRKLRGTIVTGTVKRYPDGFGFLIPDDKKIPDIYISERDMSGIMTNDRLKIEAFSSGRAGKLRGRVLQILQRNIQSITGQIHIRSKGEGTVFDESHALGADIKIFLKDETIKNKDWVHVEIIQFSEKEKNFTGKVIRHFGDTLKTSDDNDRVLQENQVPVGFSKNCKEESERIRKEFDVKKILSGREDLRDVDFVTIDGVTAKDFDDAIFVEETSKGFRLLVAIADVSHFVKRESVIDEEARKKGNSVYFPHFVVPMLPEQLSNDLCSLNPQKDRLVFVCEMQVNFQGDIEKYRFFEGVIKSKFRLTYGMVQDFLDQKDFKEYSSVKSSLTSAADLARILYQKRIKEGSLAIDLEDTEVELDDLGEPVDILSSKRLFAHQLIEEMMLATNVCAAKFMYKNELHSLYRVHQKPFEKDLKRLTKYLAKFGHNLSGKNLQKNLSVILNKLEAGIQSDIVKKLILRSMNQAQYSDQNVGHFGLAFSKYTHFTSPIRRYSDLIVHRIIKASLKKERELLYDERELSEMGTILSATEQRAVKAERRLISIKKARFVAKRLGSHFEGFITNVSPSGIFIQLREFDVVGLVPSEDLKGNPFIYDDENMMLIGKKTGLFYKIGDSVKVQVAKADIQTGLIDFFVVDQKNQMTEIPKKKKKSKKKNKFKKKRSQKKKKFSRSGKRRKKKRQVERRKKRKSKWKSKE